MGFIYSEKTSNDSFGFDPYEYSGSKMYAKHFGNLCYLCFISNNPKTSFSEKHQAEKEIVIAKRKMKYWERIAKNQNELDQLKKLTELEKKKWAI